MKKSDILFFLFVIALFLPFFISDTIYEWYKSFNAIHGMVMSFVKFAILATLGEMLGLRITPKFIKIHHHNDSFAKAGCPTSTIDAKVIPATNNNILQITVKIHPFVFIITFLFYSMTGNKDKRLWLDNK